VALSFEAIRALRTELNVLVQCVEPLKGLQDRIIEIFDSIRTQHADLAMSVEATKALRELGKELSRAETQGVAESTPSAGGEEQKAGQHAARRAEQRSRGESPSAPGGRER